MDEDTAKTKWCPMMQVSITGTGDRYVNNRGRVMKEGEKNDSLCIASDCLAWREHEQGWDADSIHEGQGYCGLAGKP